MTTKYLIFAGETYYPAGGWNDLYGRAETLDEALEIMREAIVDGSSPNRTWWGHTLQCYPREWAHIVSLETMEKVEDGRIEAILAEKRALEYQMAADAEEAEEPMEEEEYVLTTDKEKKEEEEAEEEEEEGYWEAEIASLQRRQNEQEIKGEYYNRLKDQEDFIRDHLDYLKDQSDDEEEEEEDTPDEEYKYIHKVCTKCGNPECQPRPKKFTREYYSGVLLDTRLLRAKWDKDHK
jgi:hypothetical protein